MPALVAATMTTAIVSSLGAPLVPEVAVTEDIPISAAQWTLTATLLAGAISVPILGRLGGHRHRRAVVLGAIVAAVVGTLIAALPLGFTGILIGRTIQGLAMGVTPVAIGLARNVLPVARQASALSLLSVAVVAGAGLGYPIAAFFATVWGLSAAYWFGFAVSLLTLAIAVYAVPGVTDAGPEPRVDWLGAGILSVGSAALLLAITQGNQWGWLSPAFVGVLALAALALVLWARRSLRIPNPLIDLRLTVRHGVLAPNLVGLIAGVGVYMLLSLITLLVQAPVSHGGFGQTPFVAGLLMVPYSLASFFGSRINILLARRMPIDLLLPIGCAFYAIALSLIAVAHTELWTLVLAMLLAGLGSGSTFAAMPSLVLRHAEPREGGSAMAVNQLLRSFGFSMGSAATGTILSLFVVAPAVDPDAFGYTMVAWAAAGLLVAALIVSFLLALPELRSGRGATGPDEEPEDPSTLEI